MMALSTKPNPTKGRPEASATASSCRAEGLSTLYELNFCSCFWYSTALAICDLRHHASSAPSSAPGGEGPKLGGPGAGEGERGGCRERAEGGYGGSHGTAYKEGSRAGRDGQAARCACHACPPPPPAAPSMASKQTPVQHRPFRATILDAARTHRVSPAWCSLYRFCFMRSFTYAVLCASYVSAPQRAKSAEVGAPRMPPVLVCAHAEMAISRLLSLAEQGPSLHCWAP